MNLNTASMNEAAAFKPQVEEAKEQPDDQVTIVIHMTPASENKCNDTLLMLNDRVHDLEDKVDELRQHSNDTSPGREYDDMLLLLESKHSKLESELDKANQHTYDQ